MYSLMPCITPLGRAREWGAITTLGKLLREAISGTAVPKISAITLSSKLIVIAWRLDCSFYQNLQLGSAQKHPTKAAPIRSSTLDLY